MNKIYKVMYSKVKQCCVVVSEIAKSHGHNGESSGVRKHAALTAAVLLALGSLSFTTAFVPMTAEAADKTRTDGSNFVGVERTNGLIDESKYENSGGKGAQGADSITLGLHAQAGAGTITIGDRRSSASMGSVYVGHGDIANPELDTGGWVTSIGYNSDATGYGSIALGSNAVAKNFYAKDSKGNSLKLNDDTKFRLNPKPDIQRASVAIGYGASADNGNIAIGSYSDASTDLRTAKTKDGKEIKSYLTDKMADSYVSVGDGKDHSETQYRRISNVADGASASDVATVGQLQALSAKVGVYDAGFGIVIDSDKDNKKNTISLNRKLGTNLDKTGHVYLDVSDTGLVLGTVVDGASGTDMDLHYGATGDYAVTVGGGANTASGKASVVLGGSLNKASNEATVASGGSSNVASGSMAAVYGGFDNEASEAYATILGGAQNKASNTWTAVGGGALNEASGKYASVWGGYHNKATDDSAAVYGGLGNSAYGSYSAILGGGSNKAGGGAAVVSGGASNEAAGVESAVLGGVGNIVTGANATAVGGVKGSVNGVGSVGILGGSTGINAPFTLAAGYQSTVTDTGVTSIPITEEEAEKFQEEGTHPGLIVGSNDPDNLSFKILDHFATAVGYQATADEAQTVAFGHDKGDTYYGTTTYKWKQKATFKDGQYYDEYNQKISKESYESLKNADGTWNDYSQPIATVEEKKYDSAYYNRLVKAADGIEDHDAVVMEQLKNASDVGSKIKVYQTDENGNIKFDKNNNPIEDTSDSDAVKTKREAAQKASEDAWGKAIGTGKIADPTKSDTNDPEANGSQQLVTGGTVYDALQKQKTELTDSLSVNAGWGIGIDKAKKNTISVKHNLGTGYADTDATGLILGGSLQNRDAAKEYGTATASSVIVGAQNALASNDNSVVVGGLDNVASGANSTVVGGDNNKASGNQSAVFGGRDNTASGIASTAGGGIMNVANGWQSTAIGGFSNYALGTGSTSVGGYGKDYATGHNSSVNGNYSVGIAGGSTGKDANYSLAAGRQAVVTTENGTAIGYQATTDEANTIAFGHDAGDVSGYTIEWEQLPNGQVNADGTSNDYTKAPTVTENKYESAAYNRLVKAADGVEDHDAVVMEQLKNASNVGQNIKVYKTDENGNVQFDESNNPIEDKSDAVKAQREAAQKASEDAWGTAIGTGKIADPNVADKETNGSQQLVTGGTVYSEVRPSKDGKYVKIAQTTGANLIALDDQVKTNTDKLSDVDSRSVKYDTKKVNDKTVVDNTKITLDGKGGTTITNLKGGVNDNDAATVGQLNSKIAGVTYTAGNGIAMDSTAKTISAKAGNGITVDTNGINAKAGTGITVDAAGINVNTGNHLNINANGQVDVDDNGKVAANDGNLVTGKTVYDALNGGMTKIVIGTPGENGKDGAPGTIGLVGPAGADGKNAEVDITIQQGKDEKSKGVKGANGVDGKDGITRIVYTDKTGEHQVATMEDGMKFAGDDGQKDATKAIAKKLNNIVDIIGGAKGDLTEGNIGVNNDSGKLKIQLAQELTGITSISGSTGSNGAKITLDTNDQNISVNGGKITDVASGLSTNDGSYNAKDANNAANISDVNSMISKAVTDAKGETQQNLDKKANVDASNIGTKLKGADGKTAATEDEQKANLDKWGEAIGTGEVKDGSNQLVTGNTVYNAVKDKADKSYVDTQLNTKANTDGSNIDADKFSKKVAIGKIDDSDERAVSGKTVHEAIQTINGNIDGKANKNLDNIDDAGKNVIKDQARAAVTIDNKGLNTNVVATQDDKNHTTTYTINVEGNGKVAAKDTGLISGDTLYKEVHVDKDGSYIKAAKSVGQNLSALDSGLKTTSDLIHTNTKGDTIQIGGSSSASKIDVNGKDGKGRVITGVVSDANDPNSAANVGYVNGLTAANTQQIYRDMNNAYGRLNNNINKAAAGSNALAALHPLDYDPDDKADFAVGYGHYRNANAAAVGAFYHPNENTMVNVGVSLGNGDPGFNAGVSFKVGRGGAGREAMSKTEMAKVINSQSKEIDSLKKDNADKDKRIDALEQKMAEILAKLDKNGK